MRRNLGSVGDVGEIIEAQRARLNLSQADMLLKAGMSQQQIQRIEAGANITVKTLLHLADVLGLEISISPKGEDAISSGPAPVYAVNTKKIRKAEQNQTMGSAARKKPGGDRKRRSGEKGIDEYVKKESTVMRLFGHLLDKDDE